MGIRLQQDTAQLRTDLRRFQRERLIGTLCLHFKGIRTGQHLVQIRHCLGGDVPHGLFADAGTAEGCDAEHALEMFQHLVQIDVLRHRFHVDRGLCPCQLEHSKLFQTATQIFHEDVLERSTVQALQRHFSVFCQNQFFCHR